MVLVVCSAIPDAQEPQLVVVACSAEEAPNGLKLERDTRGLCLAQVTIKLLKLPS